MMLQKDKKHAYKEILKDHKRYLLTANEANQRIAFLNGQFPVTDFKLVEFEDLEEYD